MSGGIPKSRRICPDAALLVQKLLLTALAALALTIASTVGAPAGDPIIVGLDADMSKDSAQGGEAIRRGLVLATDEINRAGGVLGRPLTLVVRDHRANPARGIDNINALAETEDLVAIVGGVHTPVALAELEAVHAHQIPFLIPWAAGTPIIEHGYRPNFVFRVSVRDEFAGGFLVDAARARGFRRLGLLLWRTGWGRSNERAITDALATLGAKPVDVRWVNTGQKNVDKEIQGLTDSGADVMILVTGPLKGRAAIEAMARRKPEDRIPIISHWGITGGNSQVAAADALAQVDLTFLQTVSFFDPPFPERARPVMDAYCASFGGCESAADIISPVGTAHAYDLIHLLARAIEQAGTADRGAVRHALENLAPYQGLVRDYAPPLLGRPARRARSQRLQPGALWRRRRDTADHSGMNTRRKTSSLLSRVIWRVFPPAAVLLFLIWYAASETTSRTVELQVRARLDLAASESAAALAAKLNVMQEAARGLAANDLIVNGIVDMQERESYLSVLFQSLRIPGPDGAVITLVDYLGRPIISTSPLLTQHDVDWLDQVMSGQDYFEVTPQGALIATPVAYAGSPEGAVIVSYDVTRVPEVLNVGAAASATLVVDESDSVLYSSFGLSVARGVATLAENGWTYARASVPGFPHLAVISALDDANANAAVAAVQNIMLITVLCSLGALGGGIVLSAYLATRPLSDFTESIGEITNATDLGRRIAADGPAEFQAMAQSFNAMIERLKRTTTSRDNFDNIVNSMQEMLIVTDANGDVTFANDAARKMFGLDRRDHFRAHILDLFREDEHEPSWSKLAPGNIDENSRSIEAVCNLKGAQPVHVLVTASRASGGEGGDQNMIYIALDVTESRKATDALFRAKQRLQTAIESISEAFALYDSDDRLVLFNSKYKEVYRETADDIAIGVTFEQIIRAGANRGQYPDAIGRVDAFVNERVALHKNPDGPFEQALPDGRWLRIEERRTSDGGVVGIRADISELKMREAELRHQAEALERSNADLQTEIELRSATEFSLRDSEMRARAVFETAADGVITIAPEGTIGSINPAAERIFGYPADELVGVNFKQCLTEAGHADLDAHIAKRRSCDRFDGAG